MVHDTVLRGPARDGVRGVGEWSGEREPEQRGRRQGAEATAGAPLPLQTYESGTVWAQAPGTVVGIGERSVPARLRIGPNPVRMGDVVDFTLTVPPGGDLVVYDLAGRAVGRAPFQLSDGAWRARWEARGVDGPLAGGLYFARAGSAASARIVVLGR